MTENTVEMRLKALEASLRGVLQALRAVDNVAANAQQQILQLSWQGQGGGGAGMIMRARPPGGGIAAVTGTVGSYVVSSAVCALEYWDGATWQDAGETGVVWNDAPNSSGTAAGLSGGAMLVFQKSDGSFTIVVDPC